MLPPPSPGDTTHTEIRRITLLMFLSHMQWIAAPACASRKQHNGRNNYWLMFLAESSVSRRGFAKMAFTPLCFISLKLPPACDNGRIRSARDEPFASLGLWRCIFLGCHPVPCSIPFGLAPLTCVCAGVWSYTLQP